MKYSPISGRIHLKKLSVTLPKPNSGVCTKRCINKKILKITKGVFRRDNTIAKHKRTNNALENTIQTNKD
jgi:hypothetical protein